MVINSGEEINDGSSNVKMKKIGSTTSGSFIVEMTPEEYGALQQLKVTEEDSSGRISSSQKVAPKMNHSERVAYVADRLRKLSPKKKDGVIRSIEAMFQFGDGLEASEVDKLLSTLQKQKFFTISSDGRVTYKQTKSSSSD